MSRTLAAAAVALVALVLPAAAQAEVVHGPEPVGDELAWEVDTADPLCGDLTPAASPEEAGAFDLTRLSVRHQRHHIALTARFAEARAQRAVEFLRPDAAASVACRLRAVPGRSLPRPVPRAALEADRHGHRR